MSVFVNYFLEANIGLVFFYMIYWLLLRKENQFSVKRAFLVGSLIASLLFPLFSIGNSTAFIPSISKAVPATWLPEMIVYGNGAPEMSAEGEFTIGWTFLSYLYLIAAAIFTLLFLFRIVSLIKLFKHSRHYTWKTYTIAESSKVQGIFSFFNFIFFNPVNHLSELDKQEILRHEEVHIQRLHSLDIMLIELIGIIFWLNPIILGYKKSLVQLHEFEADARSVKDHDEDRYCHVLAKVALQNNGYVLANHFTNSFTLKRITMIKTIRTKIRSWKILALAAALPLFFLVVACQDQIANELANSTISQVSAFPPEAKADMAIWEKKYPGSIFNYVEGSDAELKKKLHSYSNTQAILNTYNFPDRGVTGILLRDISDWDLKNQDEVFTIVEEPASPKEGIEKFYEQISTQIRYPEEAMANGIEGRVFVEFVIGEDGSILKPHVIKGVEETLNKEAVRVIGLSQPWNPGRQRGKAVKQRLVMPITFSLGGHPENAKITFDTPVEGTKQTMKVTGNLIEENGERYVTGRVVDASGKPTPGMNIILVGTSRGTVSDPNGNYKLKVDNSNGRISFSFVGFETEFLAF